MKPARNFSLGFSDERLLAGIVANSTVSFLSLERYWIFLQAHCRIVKD
jgi:hypothetical protein